MSSQPGAQNLPVAAESPVLNEPDSGTQTDQGVPVGAADARADAEQASDATDAPETDEEALDQASAEEGSDQGVPVGAADAEQDRLNASDD